MTAAIVAAFVGATVAWCAYCWLLVERDRSRLSDALREAQRDAEAAETKAGEAHARAASLRAEVDALATEVRRLNERTESIMARLMGR
jgi:predicted  nucleic acid-binding Zn-ribbon protein